MTPSVLDILGLKRFPNWVSECEADKLVDLIDQQPWLTDLKRRVQHYGFRYDYRARTITRGMALGPLPDWLNDLSGRVFDAADFTRRPDQVIINEYVPGQGISAHTDCLPCFGETIASVSLGGAVDMVFAHKSASDKRVIRLQPNDLLVLKGDARTDWTHAIPARKTDIVEGVRTVRGRRLSLTFRTVQL